jgi:CheY-like chemotaxis protein
MLRLEDGSPTPLILLVDDEAAIREMMTIFLESEGYEVGSAENGPQALRLLAERDWSLVITDGLMPGMSGEELATAIRKENASIPIILTTGEVPDETEGFRFDAVLLKPFASKALFATVETALNASETKFARSTM